MTFNGHLWTAKWWSFNDTPGGAFSPTICIQYLLNPRLWCTGAAGVWTDDGSCASARVAGVATAHPPSASLPSSARQEPSEATAGVRPNPVLAPTSAIPSASVISPSPRPSGASGSASVFAEASSSDVAFSLFVPLSSSALVSASSVPSASIERRELRFSRPRKPYWLRRLDGLHDSFYAMYHLIKGTHGVRL